MMRYIAFLRAINSSGRFVKMDYLRALFAALGFANVETFIASGNVIFDSEATDTRALERVIETHLQQELGYPVATFIRSPGEVAAVARYQPFAPEPAGHAHVQYVAFLQTQPADAAQDRLMSYRNPVDDLHLHGREVYWLRRAELGQSRVSGTVLERSLGMPATVRNVTTVRKLAARYAAREDLTQVFDS